MASGRSSGARTALSSASAGSSPGPRTRRSRGEIEIGWRLARGYWGQGYAREAAQASLDWGWANTDAATIAAITTANNLRSWGLMARLGMVRVPGDDFDHPQAPPHLIPHITYRIARPSGIHPRESAGAQTCRPGEGRE
ncbi:MAG: GNAT family N-acetyltransferase [Sphingomonas sp.]